MTGANRLLVGLAWPLLILVQWLRTRRRAIELPGENAIEVSFLLLASFYAFVILFKAHIGLTDFAVLAAIYAAYIWRVRQVPKADDADDEGEPGPAAALNDLPVGQQWATMAALAAVACGVILLAAEPFAESMVESGRALGINEFLLIQWLAPLASEAPAVSVAVLFVLAGRAAGGLTTMISDKINQWTLLVGMLPVAMSIGAGAATALPLDARQAEEFFLTGAQSLLGVALLLRLRLGLPSACLLLVMFAAQVGLAYHYRDNEAATISTLTALAWGYLALALAVLLPNARRLFAMLRFAFSIPAARR